jgi:hypothetical protein
MRRCLVKWIWRLLGQRPDLTTLERLPFTPSVDAGPRPGDNRDHYARVVAHEAPGAPEPDGPFRLLARAVLGYEIFPPTLVTGVVRRRPVQPGDTFGICYHFLPGLDLFFGGRVLDVFDGEVDEQWRAGFLFRTVAGHPELGEETFAVAKDLASGTVEVSLDSWSRPGTWLSRLVKPYTRRVQIHASKAALDQLQTVAEVAQNDPP